MDIKTLLYQDIKQNTYLPWDKSKRRWAKQLKRLPKNSEILKIYNQLIAEGKLKHDKHIADSLMTRKIRTLSGVAPFAVMMKPFACPGKCTYCVQEPGMPKSYMSDEPAAARAKKLNFDPKQQVASRIIQMENTGHKPEKIQIIIIGGTFSAYPNQYKKEFITNIYNTCNFLSDFDIKNIDILDNLQLKQLQNIDVNQIDQIHYKNQTAKYRIIGMSVETRPDWVTNEELRLLRDYGVTKVQMGVQALDDTILTNIKRGHGVREIKIATRKLRDAGFKINYHFMPNLPGSNPDKDISMIKEMFKTSDYRPDTLKIYPTIVIPTTELHQQWLDGKYRSYDDQVLQEVLTKCYKQVPYYCRVDRLVRDITKQWTASGTKMTNMRQVIEKKMKKEDFSMQDIRAREVKDRNIPNQNMRLQINTYQANNGEEYFLHYSDFNSLYAMLRLRLIKENSMIKTFPILENSAIIRELQVFGRQVPISNKKRTFNSTQHQSLGKNLIKKAEIIAKQNGFEKVVIISGVGVRNYYQKLGYHLEDTYMVKTIN